MKKRHLREALRIAGGWIVIVGASSSIARSLSREFAANGFHVLLAGRDLDDLQRTARDLQIRYGCEAVAVPLDALQIETHQGFWQECQRRTGCDISGLVVVHGYLPVQEDAEENIELMQLTTETNYTSAAALLLVAAKDFEKRARGMLCALSSVAGDRGRKSNYIYGAAKAALNTFMEGMRHRLAGKGVLVMTVKPGFVDTAMTWGLPVGFLGAEPERIAKDIMWGIKAARNELYSPWFWRYIMFVIKCLPRFIFNRLNI